MAKNNTNAHNMQFGTEEVSKMFVSTDLAAGIALPDTQKKTARSAVEKASTMSLSDKVCYVLNAVISQYGKVTVRVNMRGKKFITPYSTSTSVPFSGKTAFTSDTGVWIMDVCGILCYPQDTAGFVKWIEDGFAALNREPAKGPGHPDMTFSRIS